MAYLTATVIMLIVVCLLNLLLTLKAVQATKALTASLDAGATQPQPTGAPGVMYPLGVPVREFAALTSRGEHVSRASLTGWTLVAVLSPDCAPCHERLPEFLAAAAAVPGGRSQVLAVLVDARSDAETLITRLDQVARVVAGESAGAVAEALSVAQFPFFLWVDPEEVIAFGGLGIDMSVLPAGVNA